MNAPDKIKPKSIRVAILGALASGEITTIDDLQIKVDEPRKKLANNVFQAVVDGLAKRMRDDVTGGPAYQITAVGREYLKKYASGAVQEPIRAIREETPVITPGVKVEEPAVRNLDREIAHKDEQIARLTEKEQALVEATTKAKQSLNTWLSMALSLGCTSPDQVSSRINQLEKALEELNDKPLPTLYCLQRPAKPLVRISKIEKAKARALNFAKSGQRVTVFALIPVGAAVPGSEWRAS